LENWKVMGEKIFLKEQQVVHLGMRELGIKMAGLGSHDREAWFPNQDGQVNVQDGSAVIAWAEREGAERDSNCWEVGGHPHPSNGKFAHLVALLEGNWWEES